MKDDYTANSHCIAYTFLLKGDATMYCLSLFDWVGVWGKQLGRQLKVDKGDGTLCDRGFFSRRSTITLINFDNTLSFIYLIHFRRLR